MKKLLLAVELPKEETDRLSQIFDVTQVPNNNTSALVMLKCAEGAHAVICDPSVKSKHR